MGLKGQKLVLLFDGDILVYRAGFAAEKRLYQVGRGGPTFSSKKKAEEEAIRIGAPLSEIYSERQLEPLENAFSNLANIINGTRNTLIGKLGLVSVADIDQVIFLTGCGSNPNFREEVSSSYKANRSAMTKPTYYEEIRNHIQETYPCVLTQGAETDDYLCPASKDITDHYPDTVPIIVSIDKDLLSVPGNHYNFVKKELVVVSESKANLNFFNQMLTGDRADNIVGLKGIGPVKASRITEPFREDLGKLKARCLLEYKNKAGPDWLFRWNENCHMLWIWREIPDMCPHTFVSKDEANAYIIKYLT